MVSFLFLSFCLSLFSNHTKAAKAPPSEETIPEDDAFQCATKRSVDVVCSLRPFFRKQCTYLHMLILWWLAIAQQKHKQNKTL